MALGRPWHWLLGSLLGRKCSINKNPRTGLRMMPRGDDLHRENGYE